MYLHMSKCIAKSMNLEKPKRLIIWDGVKEILKNTIKCHASLHMVNKPTLTSIRLMVDFPI